MVSILSLVQKIFLWISVFLLLVAIPILLVGLIQFILLGSGLQFLLLGIIIMVVGFLLMILTKEERRKRIEKRRKRNVQIETLNKLQKEMENKDT